MYLALRQARARLTAAASREKRKRCRLGEQLERAG